MVETEKRPRTLQLVTYMMRLMRLGGSVASLLGSLSRRHLASMRIEVRENTMRGMMSQPYEGYCTTRLYTMLLTMVTSITRFRQAPE